MRNIYTYGGQPARRNLTVADIIAEKGHRKFTQVSAANIEEAGACADQNIDIISIWDTDISDIRTGAPETFVVAGLSMTAYHTANEILRAAIQTAEKGADAVYTPRSLDMVETLTREGLCVQGHLGLVPRLSTKVGGLRAIGKTAKEALTLFQAFRRLEDAGAYAVEVECVASDALIEISKHSGLVTHSIGSGSGGDVIFSFMEDICGDVENPPRHARAFGDLRSIRTQLADARQRALCEYRTAVSAGNFPSPAESISMMPDELEQLKEALDKHQPIHH